MIDLAAPLPKPLPIATTQSQLGTGYKVDLEHASYLAQGIVPPTLEVATPAVDVATFAPVPAGRQRLYTHVSGSGDQASAIYLVIWVIDVDGTPYPIQHAEPTDIEAPGATLTDQKCGISLKHPITLSAGQFLEIRDDEAVGATISGGAAFVEFEPA